MEFWLLYRHHYRRLLHCVRISDTWLPTPCCSSANSRPWERLWMRVGNWAGRIQNPNFMLSCSTWWPCWML